MMNILFIRTLNPFFESSADANRFAGLLKGLLERGVFVTMLITKGYNSIEEFRLNGIPLGYNNLKVNYAIHAFNSNIWLRRFNTIIMGRIFNHIAQKKISDIIIGNYDYVWLTKDGVILETYNLRQKDIKAQSFIELNEFHDIHKGNGAIGNSRQKTDADKTALSFEKALMHIDRFAIMTKTLLENYKKMSKPKAKFMHLPMTVDLSRFQKVPSTTKYTKPYIAFTGTFNNAKDGVDVLIKAFAKIANEYPQLHLYLAGFWHYDVPGQKNLIKSFGLDHRITYLGVLDKSDIPEFVCNATILALSRPDSHQAQGGFPTKLGEYLATGNPVAVTNVGEIPNYLTDGVSAFMAIPGDVESFANAMNTALADTDLARKVGLEGKRIAEKNFNLDIQASRLYDFLNVGL